MQKDKQRFTRNSLINSIGIIVYLACQWAIGVLIVRLSTDFDDAGLYSLALSISNVFLAVAGFNMRTYQVSDVANSNFDSIYIVARYITCGVALLLCSIFVFINSYSFQNKVTIIIFFVYRNAESFGDVFNGIEQKYYRLDIVGISFMLRGLLILIAFLVLYQLFNFLTAVFGMMAVSYGVVLLFDIRKCMPLKKNLPVDRSKVISLLLACFPLFLIGLIQNTTATIPRYTIELLHGKEALGVYSSVATPAVIVQVAASFIFNPLITIFSRYHGSNEPRKFSRLLFFCMAMITSFVLLSLLAASIWGEWGITLLFGDQIRGYSYLLKGTLVCAGLTAMIWFINMLLTIMREMKTMLVSNAVGLILGLALSGSMIQSFYLDGANWILIIGQGATLLLLVTSLLRYILKWSKQVNERHT